MPDSIKKCATKLALILSKSRLSRVTLSAEFFRQLTGRNRIEDAFLEQLLAYCLKNKSYVVIRINAEKFLLARTTDKYLPEDPGAPPQEEDE